MSSARSPPIHWATSSARPARTLSCYARSLPRDGLELAGIGLDPLRPPRRVLTLPRYAAMEAFFDAGGPWGRQMMCATASVQVCLDAGDDSDGPSGYRQRWRLLHAIGPVLVAAFANSPLRDGKPTGWVSSRQQVWARMDPGRTRPPRMNGDPRAAWAAYALDARVMCVPDPDSADWSAPPGLTFRDWVRGDPAATARAAPGAAHRLRGGRRGRAAAAAHRRRPRVPPVHPVPAGPAARALRAAHDRRAARRRVDRAARRVKRAAVRRRGRRRGPRGRRAALGRAMARGRRAVGARRAAGPGRPGDQPGQQGLLRRRPARRWTAWPPPPRSRRPSTPSSTST